MKKLILIQALALSTAAANAQDAALAEVRQEEHRKGFQLAAGGGVGASWLSGNNILDRAGYRTDEDLCLGATIAVGWMFTEHVGLFGGIGEDILSWKYQSDAIFSRRLYKGTVRQSYLSIPLYLRLVSGRSGRGCGFADVGFNASFLTAIKDEGTLGSSSDREPYNKSNTSFFLFTGLSIPAGTRVGVNVGPRFQYQLENNFNSAVTELSGKMMSLELRASANIRLTK